MSKNTLQEWAVGYALDGFAVFPLKEKDKTPATKNGFKDATKDVAQIAKWWEKNPNYNIGISTGTPSDGLVVIDLDIDEDKGKNGWLEYSSFVKEHSDLGEVPETLYTKTGRGGQHFLFKSSTQYRSRANILPGVDVRAEGGYIVAPPSIHPNGNKYQWLDYDPGDIEIANLPPVIDFLLNIKPQNFDSNNVAEVFSLPERVGQGERNNLMFKQACSCRERGMEEDEIFAFISIMNKSHCVPPLEDTDLHIIAESSCRYEKGKILIPANKGYTAIQCDHKMQLKTTDDGRVIQSIANCEEAITYDRNLFGKIGFNELAYAPYVLDYLPWKTNGDQCREWTNADDCYLYAYLERLGLRSESNIDKAFSNVVHKNTFNPVIDMLVSVNKQYPNQRGAIERLLPEYLGADHTRYTTEVLKVFMLGAIARVYNPGIKFDYMPIITGDQGAGKSTFLKRLAMDERWYNDNLNTIEGKEAAERIRGMWIVEMAELLAVKKSKEVEALKAFVTSTNDRYRESYSKRSEEHKRMCVLAGTTNSDIFLTDSTGNRRYLPVKTHKAKIRKSVHDDDCIVDFAKAWSEAMDIYISGNYSLVLPEDLQDEVKRMQEAYAEEDIEMELIEAWLEDNKPEKINVAMIRHSVFGETEVNMRDKRRNNQITEILNRLKTYELFEKRQRVGRYGISIAWGRKNIENDIPFEEDTQQNGTYATRYATPLNP